MYAHYKDTARASLSGPQRAVLTDLTGNRWLPFEISSIDNPYTHRVVTRVYS